MGVDAMSLVRKSRAAVIAIATASIALALPVARAQTTLPAVSGDTAAQPVAPLPSRTLAPPPPNSRAAGAQAGLSQRDKAFLIRAADGGLLQIELGQVAAARGTNPQIRQDASLASRDFDRAERRLATIAEEFGIRLSRRPPAELAKLRQNLQDESGAAVDREYVAQILREDAISVKLFTNESHDGQNPVMVQFAREMLPRFVRQKQQFQRLSPEFPPKQSE
jgi:putative membrane protein